MACTDNICICLQEKYDIYCYLELLDGYLSHHLDRPDLPLLLQSRGTFYHQARRAPLHLSPHPHRSLHHAEYHQVGST